MVLTQGVGFNGTAGITSVAGYLRWTKCKSSVGVGFHAMQGKFEQIAIQEMCFAARVSVKHSCNGHTTQ